MNRLIVILFFFALCTYATAQEVVKQGNTFIQVAKKADTETPYIYKDNKGVSYVIWLSGTGKAFIWKTSKKTGKQYKQYLPDIGKQINPQAYRKEKQL